MRKSDGKTFIKEYLKLYTQESYNRRLAKTAPLTAERLLKIAASFIPWRKKLKQFFKAKSYPTDISAIFVSVVRDYDMYDKCVGQNKFCRNVQLNPIDNRVAVSYTHLKCVCGKKVTVPHCISRKVFLYKNTQ